VTAALVGPYLGSVGLLGLAGLGKLARPNDTARALAAASLPAKPTLIRVGAGAELAIAVAACVAPGPIPPVLVALSYLGFVGFIGLALTRGWPISSCGCFGRRDTLPTPTHLIIDSAAALVAVGWTLTGTARVSDAFAHQPWGGVPVALAAAVTTGLAYLLLTNPLDQLRVRRTNREPG
jgi:hypothetical protein